MSVSRGFAQRLTKNFVATGTGGLYTESYLLSKFTAGSVTVLGDLYIVNSLDNYQNFVDAMNTNTSGNSLVSGLTLTDLGRNIKVGVSGVDNELLTFRRVKVQNGTDATSEDTMTAVGFVVVENRTSADTSPAGTGGVSISGKLPVTVSRV